MRNKGRESILTNQLLALVRASLWQTPVDCSVFMDCEMDWDGLGRLAFGQTVGPLACNGAFTLPPALCPPKEWLREAYARTERNRRTHRMLNGCLVEAVSSLENAGITVVLLKGQAYASNYPDPALRQCGDVDLYVGQENYIAACEAVRRFGWACDAFLDPNAKHYGCELHGVRVEFHRLAAKLASPSANRRFEAWSSQQLSSGLRSITIGGRDIAVPPPIFNVLFVFLHLYHHFLNGGIGLRQICDWVMLLHVHSGEIDTAELKNCLQAFGLLHAWQMFTPLLVDHLGLPESECPFYSPGYGLKAEKILAIIMREGNFGRLAKGATPRPAGYWEGKLHTFHRYSRRLLSLFGIDPVTVARAYGRYIFIGCRQVVRDKCGRSV